MEHVLRGLHIHAFLGLICIAVQGQQYSITFPSVVACSGVLEDSGGPNMPYGNNENFVTTICPTENDAAISLEFVVFDLHTDGPPFDVLRIFDGTSTNAPNIGNYSGTSLLFDTITATTDNPSGCLTLQFISNASGTGNFAAVISCGDPCPAPCDQNCPEPVAQLLGGSTTYCSGSMIPLDGSSSYGMDNAIIMNWIWSLNGAPIDTTSTPLYELETDIPGAQVVRLRVIDDAGCVSQFSEPLHLLMGADAVITIDDLPAIICSGTTLTIQADASIPTITLPEGDCQYYGNGVHLPDIGMSYSNTLFIQSAEPGSVISTLADIPEICVSMEHSYMGDLVIQISCPTGQTVSLHEQGGGSTYLGAANDMDNDVSPVPGECWNYCWSALSSNGTWVEAAMAGNTIIAGNPSSMSLLPGTYESVQPMTALYGCPKNGTWTLSIYDLWMADNGFLCNWCVDLGTGQDDLYIEVGPIPGTSPDSAFWAGVGVVNDATEGGLAYVTFVEPGAAALTFSVIDSYGCMHDTTVTIQVLELAVDAGPPIDLCDGPGELSGSLPLGNECEYLLVLLDSLGDGWQDAELIVSLNGGPTTYAIVEPGITELPIVLNVSHGQMLELSYIESAMFNDENSFILYDDLGNTLYSSVWGPVAGQHYFDTVNCFGAVGSIHWTPSMGLSDSASFTPTVFTMNSGWYVITATSADSMGCTAMDSVWVQAPGTEQIELTFTAATNTLCTGATGHESYAWYFNGDLFATTPGPCLNNAGYGSWSLIATPVDGCVLASGDTLICPLLAIIWTGDMLIVPSVDGTFTWTFDGVPIPSSDSPSIELIGDGLYTVQVVMDNGCEGTASILIDTTDIEELLQTPGTVTVHPNPSSGHFELVGNGLFGKTMQLTVLDMTGRSIWTDQLEISFGSSRAALDLDLARGGYLLQVRDQLNTWVVRMVVQ